MQDRKLLSFGISSQCFKKRYKLVLLVILRQKKFVEPHKSKSDLPAKSMSKERSDIHFFQVKMLL